MRPNMEAFGDLAVEVVRAVTGFQFVEDVRVLGFVAVFWLVLLGHRSFRAGTAGRLMTLGDFEAASLQAVLDNDWVETALGFAGLPTTLDFRRGTMIFLVDVVFGMFRDVIRGGVIGGFAELVLTWFRRISRRSHGRFARLSAAVLVLTTIRST
jgi:hypothetical protein